MIPELWEGYRGVAREEQEPSLSEAEIAEAGSRLLAIAEEARFANTVISLLLDEAVSRRGWTLEPETISMAQVLGEVLEEQPCSGSDRYGALSVDSAEDFTFRASRLICRYVLKSLLEAASAAGSIVEIKISARTTPTQLGVVCLTLDPGEEPEDGEDCEDGRRGGAATTREADDEMEVSRRMLRELHGEVLTTRKDRALSTISLRILRNSKG